ncbi:hypothetical protein ACLK2F_16585 [Escherichia coli]
MEKRIFGFSAEEDIYLTHIALLSPLWEALFQAGVRKPYNNWNKSSAREVIPAFFSTDHQIVTAIHQHTLDIGAIVWG